MAGRLFHAIGICFVCAATAAWGADPVGFREIETGQGTERPLHVALWYPTGDRGPVESIGENPAFYGQPAIRNAAPILVPHPVVLLSHGYGGSWRNLSWLAQALAERGYVVAAPDHPGTTTFDRDPGRAAQLFERPRDLSRVLDALASDPAYAGPVDTASVAAIGHSLGGWTVAALAGARFDTARFAADCRTQVSARACALTAELGLDRPSIERDMADPRLRAFVTLDLGLARGLSPDSLAAIQPAALVIGAGIDIGDMPSRLESGYLAEHLPQQRATAVEISDAQHFTFLQLCKPGAADRIEADSPGEGIVCRDGGGRDRAAIHREVVDRVSAFLEPFR